MIPDYGAEQLAAGARLRLNLTDHNGTTAAPLECSLEVTDGFVEFLIYGLLLNTVSLLGILGNAISTIVLSRPQMKSSINYLLIGLATCDTVLILLAVLVYGLPGIYAYTGYLFHYKFLVYPKIVRYLYPLSTTAHMATVYLTLTVTMERYVAVCHPLKARSLCTYGRARTAIFAIGLFSVIYNLPKLWEVELSEELHWKYNVTIFCIVPTKLRQNKLYIAIYVHWLYFFVCYAFPFAALVIFNAAIYKRVSKANRDLRRLSRHQRREIGLATMLLCVVIVFLVCNVLPLASNVYENVYVNPPTWMIQVGNLLVTFNSGVNFVIYVIFGRKFKRIFMKIFCRVSGETGLDCMGRPSRADSPDFQTNEDSIATNTSNLELRNSIRRLHSGHHHHHHPHHHSLRPSNGSSSRSSVYYPKHSGSFYNGSGKNHKDRTSSLDDTAFC
ncbi:PREDICTED: FMRFamide receptor-like [Ceratosolen solmsi marchali]|uniref:FMRFamide receptor-like n=1 Tax=Ceratosolen solmsi marchali TaxID=326594 RepID=A0AAJ6YXR9_9HYME|nr:PREDICTED: FMRFamide receptor-like [Ceratosolen solmsi marchali]XP_011506267.1 PREDICTED: FMRFamide receptor-like [Ceratosolen solmsi marchali]